MVKYKYPKKVVTGSVLPKTQLITKKKKKVANLTKTEKMQCI